MYVPNNDCSELPSSKAKPRCEEIPGIHSFSVDEFLLHPSIPSSPPRPPLTSEVCVKHYYGKALIAMEDAWAHGIPTRSLGSQCLCKSISLQN